MAEGITISALRGKGLGGERIRKERKRIRMIAKDFLREKLCGEDCFCKKQDFFSPSMRRRKGNEKMRVKRRRRRKDNAPIYSALPLLHTQKWDPCFSSPSPKCDAAALLGAQSRRHIRCFEFVALFLSLCNSASSSPSFDGFGGVTFSEVPKRQKG